MKNGTARSTPGEREIKARVAQLTALHKTLLEITAQRDLTILLQTIVRRATRLFKGTSGGLYLCHAEKQACTCAVSYRTQSDYTGTVLKYGEGAAGKVAASGQPLLIDDYRTWGTRAKTFDLEQPFRAMLAAPMLWHGQVTGVIIVQREHPFNQADLDLLTMFASQAAIVVENVRALEAERSARIQAEKDLSEHKRAEQALQASDERFRVITSNTPDHILMQDSQLKYTFVVNPQLGLTEQDMIGKTDYDFLPKKEADQLTQVKTRVLESGQPVHFETSLTSNVGELEFFDGTYIPKFDSHDKVDSLIGYFRNVTERKRAEEALLHSQEETAHVNRLLLALSQVSQAVQRTRTTEEVYSAIQDQVTQMGYVTAGFELSENGRDLRVAYFNYRADLQRKAEKMTGVPLRDFRFRPREDSIYHRIIVEGETVFVQDTAKAVADALPKKLRALARPMRDLFKLDQSIFAPLTVSDETIGLLAITGSDLTEMDIPAVTAFARQAAIAMQNARLYEQAQREIVEHRSAEEKLKASEAELLALFAGMIDVVIVYDTDGRYIKIAPTNPANLYHPPDDMLGKTLHEILPKDKADFILSMIRESIQNNQVVNGEYALEVSGKETWFFASSSRLSETTAILVAHDITERKQAEEAFRESEEKHRTLYERMAQGVVYQDTDGRIISANPAAERILGLSLDQMIGRLPTDPRWKAIHEDGSDFPGETHPSRVAQTTGKEVYNVVMGVFNPEKEANKWINIIAIPQFREGESVPYRVFTTLEDFTERKRGEDVQRESEMRLRFHVENSPIAVVEWDTNFMVTRWSGEAEKIFGWSREETIGKPIMEMGLIYEEDIPIVQKLMQQLTDGITSRVVSTNRNCTKDGKVIYCEWYNSVLQNPQGKMVSIMAQALDITERKQAEKEIESLSRFPTENPNPILRVEQDGQINYANLASAALLHLWNCTVGGYLPPHWRERVVNASRTSVRTTVEVECEERFYSILIVPIPDQGYVNLYGRDITELKLVEAQLVERHATLNALLESATSPVFSLDRDYRYTSFNNAHAVVMKGLYGAEIEIGQNMLEYQAVSDDREEARKNLDCALSGKQVVESAYSGEPGRLRRYYEIAHNPIFDPAGEVIGVSVFASDITERKQAELALQESEKALVEAQQIAQVGSWEYEIAIDKPRWSKQMFDIFGRAPGRGEPSWQEHRSSIHPDDWEILDASVKAAVTAGTPYAVEFRVLHPTKGVRWGWTIGQPVCDIAGEVVKLRGTVQDITERKQAEEALRESHLLTEKTLASLLDAVFIIDIDTAEIIDCNPAASAIFGYSRQEMLSRTTAFLHVDQESLKEFRRHLNSEVEEKDFLFMPEFRMKRKDGTVFPTEHSVIPLENEQGKRIGWVSVVRDITERKQAEEALRKSEENFRNLSENSTDGILIVSPAGRHIYANSRASELLGYSPVELLQTTMRDLADPTTYPHLKQRLQDRFAGRFVTATYETIVRRKNGTSFPVDVTGTLTLWQGQTCALIFLRDITERKGSEEALRNREGLLQKIFDILPVGLWIADKDGQLLRGNPAGVKIWGAEPKVSPLEYGVFKGRRLPSREEVASDDWALVHTIRDKVTIVDELLEIDAFDGQKKTILNYTAPVLDAQGDVQGAIVVNQDITERRRSETELAQSHEQLRALTLYWQTALEDERAHIARELHDEFGQSMTALKMDLAWLTKRLPKGDEKVERIRDMETLVDDSIALMRRIATDLRPALLDDLGLNAALEWQAQEFSQHWGIPCKLNLPKDDLDLDHALSTSLFRIFQETLTNINRHAQATRVNASLKQNKQTLVLTIQDNGRGITEGELTNPRSLGLLGLRERAAQWGGKTTLRGTAGKGTTVTVRIPLPASPMKGDGR